MSTTKYFCNQLRCEVYILFIIHIKYVQYVQHTSSLFQTIHKRTISYILKTAFHRLLLEHRPHTLHIRLLQNQE